MKAGVILQNLPLHTITRDSIAKRAKYHSRHLRLPSPDHLVEILLVPGAWVQTDNTLIRRIHTPLLTDSTGAITPTCSHLLAAATLQIPGMGGAAATCLI